MPTRWLAADPLDGAAIAALLSTRTLGRPLEVHPRLASTNDRVRELERQGAEPGVAVLAEEQTAGRGRAGRRWVSPPGTGVWLTVLVALGGGTPGLLALSSGVAVRRALRRAAGVGAALKWPNDVEVGGGKLGGILGEVVGGGKVALGIGLNVHAAPPAAAVGRAAVALDDAAGRVVARNPLVALLLGELEAVTDGIAAGRHAQLIAEWRGYCNHEGARVEVRSGSDVRTGIATGVDPSGALLLERDGRVEPVAAGSLRVLEMMPGTPRP